MRRTTSALAALTWLVASIPLSSAEPGVSSLAEEVSTARADVDSLADRLESQRRSTRENLSALRTERAELQRQIRLERVRQETLSQLRSDRVKRVDEQEGRVLEILKPIRQSVQSAMEYVEATLPFKQEERMRRLKQIEADLAVTHPDPGHALSRLWRFIEEEKAMAGEVALGQQAITLDGTRVLVEVARIGMALMYFRLPGGDVGWVRRVKGVWQFERVASPDARKTIVGVFQELEANRILGSKRLLITKELPAAAERSMQ